MRNPSQQDIESWPWKAANILRKPDESTHLRDFVFPPLFLKLLYDVWAEEQERSEKEFSKYVDAETAGYIHPFAIPNGCHWSDLRPQAENHRVFGQG